MQFDTVPSTPCYEVLPSKAVSCRKSNLDVVPNDLFSDIITLDLSWNDITSLETDAFWQYTVLEKLNLSYNHITDIAKATFSPLKHLTILDLSGNINLNNIRADAFESLPKLLLLNLQSCGISSFPHDGFRGLPNLQKLILRDNPINTINFTICPHKEMELLDLSNTSLQRITNETLFIPCVCQKLKIFFQTLHFVTPEVFSTLNVKELLIGVQQILDVSLLTQIYKYLFQGIALSSIESLSFTGFDLRAHTTIKELAPKRLLRLEFIEFDHFYALTNFPDSSIFASLRNVQSLDLFNISASSNLDFPASFFTGMHELKEVDMSYNKLLSVNGSFENPWTVGLLSLNLSFNLISFIRSSTFYGLETLILLDLSENRILRKLAISLPNLRYLNVSYTELELVDEFYVPMLISFSFSGNLGDAYIDGGFLLKDWQDGFRHAESLKYLDLSNSRLSLRDIYNQYDKISLLEGVTNLTYLDLHHNYLHILMKGMFTTLSVLEKLYLKQCQIASVQAHFFDGFHSLSTLDLGDNNIICLPPTLFTATTRLQFFFIHDNILNDLDKNLFIGTPNLTQLKLNKNDFTTFNMSTFIPIMSSIKSIDLSENPLECSCDLKWLAEWLRDSQNVHEMTEGTCSPVSGNSLHGMSLASIDPTTMCNSYISLYSSISCVAVLVLIIIVITFHNRWLVKYQFFILKLYMLGYREIENLRGDENFQYDLTIMFTGDDEVWATQFLKRNLEEQLPQFHRIAFGDEDLPLGMYSLDAVLYLIEHSFKTILLLSRAAIQDNDFMLKLRIALNSVTNANMQGTILVFLENIPDEEMPCLVKSYLGDQMFYINWIESREGQRYFWKQLIKRLKVDVRRNNVEPPE